MSREKILKFKVMLQFLKIMNIPKWRNKSWLCVELHLSSFLEDKWGVFSKTFYKSKIYFLGEIGEQEKNPIG